jgi:hypothetical protein
MELNKMVDIQFKSKNAFVVLMAALQKRIGENLVPNLLFQRLIHLLVKITSTEIFSDGTVQKGSEEQRSNIEMKVKIIALLSIVDKYCLIGPSFDQSVPSKKQKKSTKIEDAGSSDDSESASEDDDEEGEDEESEVEVETVSKGSKYSKSSTAAGATRVEEKISELIAQPIKSLVKLLSIYTLTLNNAILSVKTLKPFDYFSHFILLKKCPNLKQLLDGVTDVPMSGLHTSPIGQMLYQHDSNNGDFGLDSRTEMMAGLDTMDNSCEDPRQFNQVENHEKSDVVTAD